MTDKRRDPRNLHSRFDYGNWFLTYRKFYAFMDPGEVALICFLINQQQQWTPNDPDAWFFCKNKTITRNLYFPVSTLTRMFKRLQQRGYLKTERRGLPAKRWIWVNYEKLEQEVDKVYSDEAKLGPEDRGQDCS